jgi:hypothetical protein
LIEVLDSHKGLGEISLKIRRVKKFIAFDKVFVEGVAIASHSGGRLRPLPGLKQDEILNDKSN